MRNFLWYIEHRNLGCTMYVMKFIFPVLTDCFKNERAISKQIYVQLIIFLILIEQVHLLYYTIYRL